MRNTEHIAFEAAGWLNRMNRAAFDSAEGARFDAWMDADPRNRKAFAEVAASWDDELVEQACAAARAEQSNARSPRSFFRSARWLPFAASVVLLVVTALVLVAAFPRNYETPPGATRSFVLSDGTRVSLGGNSAVTVQYWPWRREVELMRGEAGFDVAHSSWRPFRVKSGKAKIAVLGTAFHVDRLSPHRVVVGVERGKVRLSHAQDFVDIAAGEAGLATDSGVRSTPLEPEQNRLRSGWFVMRDAPLGDLIEKMRRYSARSIEVDPALANGLRLTGRFRVSATEETLALLHDGYGLDISRTSNGTYIVK